jgi:hypothetical protein
MQDEIPNDDNLKQQAAALIDRVRALKTFTITRQLDAPLEFRGAVPFDIKANQEQAWFKVTALTEQEAERMVDRWLMGEDL